MFETVLSGAFILEPDVYSDSRGFFYESWSSKEMQRYNLCYTFVQDNHSFSEHKGTLRGIHFQSGEHAQTKLVRCSRGRILDVAVNLNRSSLTYGQWISVELSSQNYRQLLVPKQFGHGFITLEDNCEVQYKVDYPYVPHAEGGVHWNDSHLRIDWGIQNPLLSEKDSRLPNLGEIENLLWR